MKPVKVSTTSGTVILVDLIVALVNLISLQLLSSAGIRHCLTLVYRELY